MQEDDEFYFPQALKDIQAGNPLWGKEVFLVPLIKRLTDPSSSDEFISKAPSRNQPLTELPLGKNLTYQRKTEKNNIR